VTNRPLRIVQVSATERGGGAEAVALGLHEGFRRRGHDATLLVGRGTGTGPGVRSFPRDLLTSALHALAGGVRVLERAGGLETYRYPAAARALRALPDADVIHLHNLHGGYFDLRLLGTLSRRVPVVLTLHDAWLLSGHCAHSLGCERWRTGCGACPDLGIYPAIRRDATAQNWQRKKQIFTRSRLHVATPSGWLAQRVRESMLGTATAELRVIPNGVDIAIFSPGDRADARRALGLPVTGPIVLAVGSAARENPFKDPATAEAAVVEAGTVLDRDIVFVRVAGDAHTARMGRTLIMDHPYQQDAERLALYYRAADVYVHAARADTFPTAVLEAMACGTPVVATDVGGIAEQLRSGPSDEAHDVHGGAGILTGPAAATEMAQAIATLLSDDALRAHLGRNAACIARRDYDREAQCAAYLDWYRSLAPDTIAP
jgi:glycosyltransferase involved in cell wall biosynthesis